MATNITEKIKALAGHIILVGKKPTGNDLMISVNSNGKTRSACTTAFGRVPGSVSRCKPEHDIAHCKISIDSNGVVSITNVKSENYTFVNGMEVVSKKINSKSTVELGPNRFRIDITEIISIASKLISRIPEGNLKNARSKFETAMRSSRQEAKSNIAVCNTFTALAILAGITTIILKKAEPYTLLYIAPLVLTAIAAVFTVLKFTTLYKMRHVDAQRNAIKEYIKEFSCPNCGAFIGDIPYEKLKSMPQCPECNERLTN